MTNKEEIEEEIGELKAYLVWMKDPKTRHLCNEFLLLHMSSVIGHREQVQHIDNRIKALELQLRS